MYISNRLDVCLLFTSNILLFGTGSHCVKY